MSDPNNIVGMSSHLNGDTFLKRLDEEQMQYLRERIADFIQKRFGRNATDYAIDLAVEAYAQGIDDVGGTLVVLARARDHAKHN